MSLNYPRLARNDLMTPDPDGARAFYAAIAGWAYSGHTIDAGGQTIGGVMGLDGAAGLPAHWMPYIAVADVDAALARATELGGEVCQAGFDLPGLGRFGILSDPAGAWVSLMTFEATPGHYEGGERGRYCWFELVSRDVGACAAFYAALLGWDAGHRSVGDVDDYVMFSVDGQPVAGLTGAPMADTASHWLGYIAVEDIDAAVAQAQALGASLLHGPRTAAGVGRVATIRDPQGAVVALWGIGTRP